MALATIDSFGYKLFVFLHIASVIVAFAPAFVWPFVSVRLRKAGKPVGTTINELAGGNTMKIHGPAFALAGIFGFGLVGLSDKVYEFSQTWVSIAMLLWFVGLGVMFGLMAPAEKKAQAGDEGSEAKLTMYGGMLHLLLFLLLIDMVWKPGL
jgi:uncharacterized membrane protein